jgi:dolichol-phosphate mannosyltransferase
VFGSRTVQAFIWSNANMGWFLRQGNWAVAKLIEVIFNTAYLSDVGCTYRVLSRECIERISPGFSSDGSRFGLETQLLVVPVNYRPRVGTSAVTGDRRKAVTLGLDMIWLVVRTRARSHKIRAQLGRRA